EGRRRGSAAAARVVRADRIRVVQLLHRRQARGGCAARGMSDGIRLYVFDGGSVYLPLRNVTLGAGQGGEMITTPIPWFVLTHPRGNVIVDGGNAPQVAVDAKAHWGAITEMSTAIMEPEQACLPSLERAGIDPAS